MRRIFTNSKERSAPKGLMKTLLALAVFVVGISGVRAQFLDDPAPYCRPTFSNMSAGTCTGSPYGMRIEQIELNGLTNSTTSCYTSSNSGSPYDVYRYWNNGPTTTLSPGATYTVKVVTGFLTTSPTNYPLSVGAWIDYDQDNNFSSSEFIRGTASVLSPPGGGVGAEHLWNFTVPCSSKPGVTRIRFIVQYSQQINSTEACRTNFSYGEVQDYNVTIANSTSPSADFFPPDTIYTGAPAKFVNSNQTGYIKHVWEVIGQGYADSNDVNLTYAFPTAGNYQIRLTSTNCGGTAIKTKNVVVVDPTRKPEANFVVSKNSAIFSGSAIIEIDFFDLSSYGATNWEWQITPDYLTGAQWIPGGSPYDQNFNAVFYGIGEYDVCLIASNSLGIDTMCKYGYIKILAPGAGSNFINKMGEHTGSDLDSGLIYDSGGANGDYKSSENWNFLIASCGAERVELTFNSFNTAGANDKLSIYEGASASGKLLGKFSGTTLPPMVTAEGDKMYLVFESDGSGNGPGFEAAWKGVQANNGAPMADFALPDTLYTCTGGAVLNIENMSTGIIPGQPEYDWLMEYTTSVTYPPGMCDVCDEENPSYTYNSTGTYNIRMVLQSCEGNDTIVKSLVVANTLSNPTVDFSTSETIVKVGGTVVLEEEAVAGCSYEWSLFPTTYTIQNGGSATDRQVTVKFTGPGSYHVTLKVTNDNGTTTRTKTNYIEVIQHCSPTVDISTVSDLGISRVKVGDIDNITGTGVAPGYNDYTNLSTTVMPGETYTINLERPGMINNVSWKVWIDWNRDGDFTDFNEEIVAVASSSSDKLAANFTVPSGSDLTYGETKMRVGTAMGNASNTPCGPNQTGEFEDYTIIISPDVTPPVLELKGGDTVIQVNTYFVDPGATAFDNIEGNISSRIVTIYTVDTSQTGVYYIFYNVSDLSGNKAPQLIRKVVVAQDLETPIITLSGANPLIWSAGVDFQEPGFTAIDMPAGNNIDDFVVVSGTVMHNKIDNYVLTYEVSDVHGNTAITTRTVQVRDTTSPTVVANLTYDIQVGQPFNDPVIAMDDFDAEPVLSVVSGSVNTAAIGQYGVKYIATDESGNVSAEFTVTFNVADFIAPTIEYIPGTNVITVDVYDFDWESDPMYKVTTSDNFYQTADLTVSYSSDYNMAELGTYTVTYEATDKGGNVAVWNRTVIVADREKPQVISEPLNLVRWTAKPDWMEGVNVRDNYYAPNDFSDSINGCYIEVVKNNVNIDYPNVYQVCYEAVDGSGNRSNIHCRQVNVVENTTGLNELNGENSVRVYPNPNKGTFTLEINGTLTNEASVTVVDAVGRVIAEIDPADLQTGSTEINLDNTAAGVYFIKVTDGQTVASKRVIITR